MRKLAAVLLAATAVTWAADWLNSGGDAQRSNWQKRERAINAETVKGLRAIWKVKLAEGLTGPVILGHLVTHRGTVELVYVASRSGEVFAVDGDFGKVFWKRQLGAPIVSTPVIAPSIIDEEEDDDAQQPVRPLYVLTGDGLLHALQPNDGRDLSEPRKFIPGGKIPSDLNLAANTVYATTPEGIWSIDRVMPGGAASFSPARVLGRGGVSIGEDGPSVAQSMPGGVARTDDSIYATTRTQLIALHPDGKRMWASKAIFNPGPPVVAGGVVFVLSKGGRGRTAILLGFDAATGKRTYSSGSAITLFALNGSLAVANGHVVFSTADGTLWCFGFPVDI